jgi:mRNA interferase RelE/StbE
VYQVVIGKAARKALSALQAVQRARISKAIHSLGNNPRPQGVTKLAGAELYRIRVGDYRVVYAIDDTIRVVSVTNVGHRRDIYRNV